MSVKSRIKSQRSQTTIYLILAAIVVVVLFGFFFVQSWIKDTMKMSLDEALGAYYYKQLSSNIEMQQEIINKEKDIVVGWSYDTMEGYLSENEKKLEIPKSVDIDKDSATERLSKVFDNVMDSDCIKMQLITDSDTKNVNEASVNTWWTTVAYAEEKTPTGYKLTDDSCAIMASAMVAALNADGKLSTNTIEVESDYITSNTENISKIQEVKSTTGNIITTLVKNATNDSEIEEVDVKVSDTVSNHRNDMNHFGFSSPENTSQYSNLNSEIKKLFKIFEDIIEENKDKNFIE